MVEGHQTLVQCVQHVVLGQVHADHVVGLDAPQALTQINGQGRADDSTQNEHQHRKPEIGRIDLIPEVVDPPMGGRRHDEADNIALVIENGTECPAGHIPVGGLGVGQIAFTRQSPVLVAAVEGLADLRIVHMIDADGIRIRDGDVVQVIGEFDDAVQIFLHILGTFPGENHIPDGGGTAQALHRGDQDLVDLPLEGPQGIAQGDGQGHGQQQKPAAHDPAHHS